MKVKMLFKLKNQIEKTVKAKAQIQLKDQLEGQIERLTGELERAKEHKVYLEKELERYGLVIRMTEAQIDSAVSRLLKLQEKIQDA